MLFILVIIIGLLQMNVLREVNLLVVLVVFFGLKKGAVTGLLIGAAIGMFSEILSSFPFCLNLMLYSIVGLASGIASSQIYYKENIFMEMLFSFCGLILFYSVYFILTITLQVSIFSTILLSTLVAPILFRIAERYHAA